MIHLMVPWHGPPPLPEKQRKRNKERKKTKFSQMSTIYLTAGSIKAASSVRLISEFMIMIKIKISKISGSYFYCTSTKGFCIITFLSNVFHIDNSIMSEQELRPA